MKRLVIFSIIAFVLCSILVPLHITQMRLKEKSKEYKKCFISIKKTNAGLKRERDILKKADYDMVRKEATKLGLLKEEEKIIRFLPNERATRAR
ncbi:MAG: septum formation initiator family protein [bacterium]